MFVYGFNKTTISIQVFTLLPTIYILTLKGTDSELKAHWGSNATKLFVKYVTMGRTILI